MQNFKILVSTCFGIFLLALNCIWLERDSPTKPPPGTHKEQFLWLNQDITIAPYSYKAFPKNLQYQDTLNGAISLLEGDFIACYFIADDDNYHKWISLESCEFIYYQSNSYGGSFYIWMPVTDKCYYVILNSDYDNTIKVHSNITITRWVE